MKTYLVVTLTCPDHPGIVERLSEVVAEYSGNWEESRMARLGGDFAGIVRISAPHDKTDVLADALRAMANEELWIGVKVTPLAKAAVQPEYLSCQLRLTGADHEGIVHEVASTLANQGINVESMETEVTPAPVTGSPLFRMEAQIQVPPRLSLAELRNGLKRLGEELGVDMDVWPLASS